VRKLRYFALASLDAGIEEARRHDAGAVGHLRIGFGLGAALELTPYIVEEFSRQFPKVEIEMREFGLPVHPAGHHPGRASGQFHVSALDRRIRLVGHGRSPRAATETPITLAFTTTTL
jgi:hypothetical protein